MAQQFKSTMAKTQDGTITFTITLPVKEIERVREEVVLEIVKNTTLPGFRKGMASRIAVEQKMDKMQVQEDVLRKLLPQAYTQAVEEHKIKPIISPRIHVEKLED